jgi:hypothetical protein
MRNFVSVVIRDFLYRNAKASSLEFKFEKLEAYDLVSLIFG